MQSRKQFISLHITKVIYSAISMVFFVGPRSATIHSSIVQVSVFIGILELGDCINHAEIKKRERAVSTSDLYLLPQPQDIQHVQHITLPTLKYTPVELLIH